jgi:Protein of unknown function/AsmA-like C-terminal region
LPINRKVAVELRDAQDKQDHPGPAWTGLFGRRTRHRGSSETVCLRVRRWRPKWLARSCLAVGALLLLIALAFSALMMRLASGPVSVALIGQQIKTAVAERFGNHYQVVLGDTQIVDSVGGPALSIDGFSLKDQSGRTIVAAPQAAVSVDPLSLIFGKVSVRRLELQDLELRLLMVDDGSIAITAGTDVSDPILLRQAVAAAPVGAALAAEPALPPDRGAFARVAALVAELFASAADPDSPLGALQRLGIARGRLIVDDRSLGQARVYEGFNLAFDRPNEQDARLTASANGPQGHWSTTARMHGRPDEPRELQFDFHDLSLDEFTIATGLRDVGVDFDMPISGKVKFALSADGKLVTANSSFAFGAGYVRMEDPDHEPFLIDELTGSVSWNEQTQTLNVDQMQLYAGDTHFLWSGSIRPPRQIGEDWTIALTSTNGVFGPERPGEKPINISSLNVAARYSSADNRLMLDKVDLSGPELALSLDGEIAQSERGTRLKAHVTTARRMPLQNLIRLWPSLIVADVRSWFLANVQGGTVEDGALSVDFDEAALVEIKARRAPPDDAVHMDFSISDGRITSIKGLPPLIGVDGNAHITGRTAIFTVPKAVMEVQPGKRLAFTEAAIAVPDTTLKPPLATITARVTGGADTVAELLGRDALKAFAPLPVEPAAVKGQFDGRLAIDFKLGKPAPSPDTQVRLNAALANLSLDRLVGPERLEAATLALSVDKNGMKAKGDGRLFGVPTSVDIKRPPNAAGEAVFAFTLDDATRAKHGFNFGTGLTGPVSAKITAPLLAAPDNKATIELDFSKAAIDGAFPGLVKAAGRPAKATIGAELQSDGTMFDPLVYEGNGVTLRGSAKLDAEGNFVQAKFTQARFSPTDDMKIDVSQVGDFWRILVRGSSIDMRPFLPLLLNPGPNRDHRDFEFDLKTSALIGHNGQVASGVDLRLLKRANMLQQLNLSGHFGRAPIVAALSRRDGLPTIAVTSQDAGAVVSFFDFYRRMQGGELAMTLRPTESRLDGAITIRDFVLRDEPAMRRLVADESVGGQRFGNPDIQLDASAVPFNKLSATFTRGAGRIELRDGVMWGPQIGATVEGAVDFAEDRVNLGGTFVPAYQVNNLFSKIPLVGMLLGGGKNEGLFGINYRISGAVSAPIVTFNPLSAMTPGFLRKIFGAIDGTDVRSRMDPARAAEDIGPTVR